MCQQLGFSIWVGFKKCCRKSFLFFMSFFSGDHLEESLLLLLELLWLVEQCLFLFLDVGFVDGIYLARLLTAFTRVPIDLPCFLYNPSSLKTLSEVSIVAVLLILLLDCSGWATGCVCGLPRLSVIWILWLFLLPSASLFSEHSMSGYVVVVSLSSYDMITIGDSFDY